MPSMGPARLRTLLTAEPPGRAWARANADTGASVAGVQRAWQRQTSLGIQVLLAGQPSYPARLADDPHAPAVLFCLGDPTVLTGRTDGGAGGDPRPDSLRHRGGRTVRRRPRRRRRERGVGSGPGHRRCRARGRLRRRRAAHRRRRWRARPRLSATARAALGAGGVHRRHRVGVPGGRAHGEVAIPGPQPSPGGLERRRGRRREPPPRRVAPHRRRGHGQGLPVGAVPGSIRSATSEGTNALLADGAFPVCSSGDILIALALEGAAVAMPPHAAAGGRLGGGPRLRPRARTAASTTL